MHGSIGSLKPAYLRPCLKYEQNSQKKITQNPNNLPPPIIKKHISRRISSSRIVRIGQVREELGFRTEEEVQTREKWSAVSRAFQEAAEGKTDLGKSTAAAWLAL